MDNSTIAFYDTHEHTQFSFPPTWLEIIGLVVIFAISALANAGGLGGGGMQTPYLMVFFNLSIFECVPLANLFGLIATSTRFLINYKQTHPNPEQA